MKTVQRLVKKQDMGDTSERAPAVIYPEGAAAVVAAADDDEE